MKEIFCADAFEWLPAHHGLGAIVTSLPDANELRMESALQYRDWFRLAVACCFDALPPGMPAVFCQTDAKGNGEVISKAALMCEVASLGSMRLLWHKIIVRRGIGKIDLHRPGFSHLMAFGDVRCKPGPATPDVIERGNLIYNNGFPSIAAELALQFMVGRTKIIVDPFCGRGTVPVMAEEMGFDAYGVDNDPEQCKFARELTNVLEQA